MRVHRHNAQAILHGAGGNPNVVGRDGRSSLSKTSLNPRVPFRCFLVNLKKPEPRRLQEQTQVVLILSAAAAASESRLQFPQNDWADVDVIGDLESVFD